MSPLWIVLAVVGYLIVGVITWMAGVEWWRWNEDELSLALIWPLIFVAVLPYRCALRYVEWRQR